jgi:arylsulfatase
MTGLYPKSALPYNGSSNGGLHAKATTLPEALKEYGYGTYMSGKWHLSSAEEPDGENAPHHRGFDRFYGTIHGASDFFAPSDLQLNGQSRTQEWENNPDYYYTDAKTDYAIKFLKDHQKQQQNKPFFLYLSYTAAHWPLHAKDEDIANYKGRYDRGWDELRRERFERMKKMGVISDEIALSSRNPEVQAWSEAEAPSWQARRMEVYAAQITSMDRNIGRVVQYLKRMDQFDNTLILFQHDNGACHVEYTPTRKGSWSRELTTDGKNISIKSGNIPGLMPGPQSTFQSYGVGWANASNTPFRKSKSFDHEGGTRSPLIVSWPKGLATELKGKFDDTFSHVIDMMPTLLQVAELKNVHQNPMPFEGRSFYSVFKGQNEFLKSRGPIYWNHSKGRAVRLGNWKLVAESKKGWELYDLKDDPVELNNLIDKMPEKAKELESLFVSWDKRTNLKLKRK